MTDVEFLGFLFDCGSSGIMIGVLFAVLMLSIRAILDIFDEASK